MYNRQYNWVHSNKKTFWMIDSAYIRENSDNVVNNLANRGYEFDINAFIKLDEEKRGLQKSLEEDRKSTRLNSSHVRTSRMPSSA